MPVLTENGRPAATLEWGTQVRGRYDTGVEPELVLVVWDFDRRGAIRGTAAVCGWTSPGALECGGERVHGGGADVPALSMVRLRMTVIRACMGHTSRTNSHGTRNRSIQRGRNTW